MMTREELCEICRDLEKAGHAFTVTLLLKHDREQREALVLAEGERDAMESMVIMLEENEWAEHASKGPVSSRLETCITTLMNELSEANERADEATVSGMAYAEERDEAKAQLARSTRLYFSIRHIVVDTANSDASGKYHLIDDAFMDVARFAQSAEVHGDSHTPAQDEQQEARVCHDCNGDGVIPVMEKDYDGNWIEDRCRTCDGSGQQQEAQGAQAGDGYFASPEEYAEQRAALATQPAADKPVAWMIDWPDEPELGHYFSESPDELTGSRSRPLFTAAPPAAAHGDEAVRKDATAAYVDMSCNSVLIDGATCYYLPSERMAAFDRMFSLGDAMRAQAGEGGE
ncbi:hypothetical protein G7008_03590 [Pseudomonas psychrotolerans]|uniref:zinc finger-like domain-containing protein n=1 Tax=Pseudomonas oryzihabitans TaxID=47885 RepID=UPI0015E406E8|nr:zinc finger-like domain-containing protein [Pseudomonas psychrotolerans]MBA1179578.1 hypothetical protein [Pseudomonas psychrotolerans]MBA1212181.1 hypothetical protein [Pseudomonas psychrotolerans]